MHIWIRTRSLRCIKETEKPLETIYMDTHLHTYIKTHTHTHTLPCMDTHLHTYTHTHTRTYTHTPTQTDHRHRHTHITTYGYTPTHLHTDTHARYLQVRRLPPQHRKCNIAARDSPSFSRAFVNAAVSWGGAVPRGYENSQELALVILYSAFRHILQHTAICCNTLQHVCH